MRRRVPETTEEWLEKFEPEFEDATKKLVRMIHDKSTPREDLMVMAEYIGEFFEDNDPRSMGWVGSDGLP